MSEMIEIRGFEELMRDLGKLGDLRDKIYWPVHDAMSQSVQLIEGRAKENLTGAGAVGFGQLRSSIGSDVTLSETELVGIVGTNVSYAEYVEQGTGPAAEKARYLPPLEPLVEWVRVKGLAGTYSLRTRRRMGKQEVQRQENVAVARRVRARIWKRGTPAQPYFGPAVEASREEVQTLFDKAVDQLVELVSRE